MTAALQGRVVVVTGAGKGLGRAVAERFGAEGATVVVSDIDGDAAERVAAGIPGASHRPCDVRDEQQVQDLVAATVDRHGGLHVLVPNAGVGKAEALLQMDLAAWRAVTSVNLDGVFLSIRYGAPAIIASGGGTIVTLASVTATTGSALVGHYAAVKAGVVNLTRTAATELGPHGVRVNALLPGFVDTDLVTSAAPDFEAALGLPPGGFDGLIEQKQGRYGTPGEIAEAALFFASDRSAFCNGSGLVLDGGLHASLL
ncbi:3-oxoacyl-[acyl-carrier protein] reductase [Pseudonocardia sp. Ae168_Ps1]|uniref:SDR family oxidoreductase n=1 Tax=unclassified Pseudonocardia TaxID=2619320 RepID=UPI00094AF691|nr:MULTISPECIES: SDR family oxidoreductase [unclassified Pseudonocardia]OLL72269.1 3-oxoacyl-[acyl-carrier protein] reductase [Pseudonocardia sp. Ae150A_Ps1]OLL78239.1 3-oxoacyl-[acyl-carrier protein] reductase [Pseudonocardia sp. Ae168_Ps1]OLL87638.1 3-oxoacyl-[acyl-carrier protein] reductase [Pseudonocardia sp. Ae263_Ps1]OLL92335.1 3-oxoacyl-[acyl-carrier protein] reductase [Pseudonocardia sp. Ae356_Ps1]